MNADQHQGVAVIHDRKVIVCDIDGTLTLGREPDQSYAEVGLCMPMREKLCDLKSQGYWIILYSSRNMRTHQGNLGLIHRHTAPVLIDWLQRHDVPFDELHLGKPWCGHDGFYVDDRAVRPKEFLQKTPEELEQLLEQGRIA
mgnify:CR=1 FL=1